MPFPEGTCRAAGPGGVTLKLTRHTSEPAQQSDPGNSRGPALSVTGVGSSGHNGVQQLTAQLKHFEHWRVRSQRNGGSQAVVREENLRVEAPPSPA